MRQRVITGRNESGLPVVMPAQVADVNKVLGSAREMLEAGSRVVLDRDPNGRDCSYIERKASGRRAAVHERSGSFQFNVTAPKPEGEEVSRTAEVNVAEGFPRQGTIEAD